MRHRIPECGHTRHTKRTSATKPCPILTVDGHRIWSRQFPLVSHRSPTNHPELNTFPTMPIQPSTYIEIKVTSTKGRGVFARKRIPAGTEFEKVPVLVLPAEEALSGEAGDVLADYVFEWGEGTVALALGFGSIYNHSYRPNARYNDCGRMVKVYTALVDIEEGEEITINYNGHEEGTEYVGFDVFGEEVPDQTESEDYEFLEADELPEFAS